jgi:outer membrane protein assembly factor BamB
VYAVDAETGERRWDAPFNAGAPVRSTPTLAGDGLVVAARSGEVFKLDLASGTAQSGPIEAGDRVYADLTTDGSSVFVKPTSATLYVMDAAGGLAAETFPLPE